MFSFTFAPPESQRSRKDSEEGATCRIGPQSQPSRGAGEIE